jgi:hypothetical protein
MPPSIGGAASGAVPTIGVSHSSGNATWYSGLSVAERVRKMADVPGSRRIPWPDHPSAPPNISPLRSTLSTSDHGENYG